MQLFKPNKKVLEIFHPFESWGEVVSQYKVLTKTLDSIKEIEELDIWISGLEEVLGQDWHPTLEQWTTIRAKIKTLALTTVAPPTQWTPRNTLDRSDSMLLTGTDVPCTLYQWDR